MKPDVLVNGMQMPHVMEALEKAYTLHKLFEAKDRAGFLKGNKSAHPRHRHGRASWRKRGADRRAAQS